MGRGFDGDGRGDGLGVKKLLKSDAISITGIAGPRERKKPGVRPLARYALPLTERRDRVKHSSCKAEENLKKKRLAALSTLDSPRLLKGNIAPE